jgi:DNA-directed RNA polymerase subunit RPC12/RpoP
VNCLRVYTCPHCGYQVLIQNGRTIQVCECMQERIAIHEESKQADAERKERTTPKQGTLNLNR